MPILSALGLAIFCLCLGLVIGLVIGYNIWGPKWFDTSEGIDRRLRNMKDF